MLVSERIGQFFVESDGGRDRLEYTEYGSGDEWVVLLHGLLGTEVVEQRHDLLAERRHRVHERVGGLVGAAVAEQVERHHVEALCRHRPRQRLLHPPRHE